MSMLNEHLFEVQRQALQKGHNLPGFAYFLEMGLGKTRTTLYDAYWHLKAGRIDLAIILCPRSLRGAWREEGEDIGFPYPILPMEGTAKDMLKTISKAGKCVVVIHYDIVLTRGGDFIDEVLKLGLRTYIALDESTRIKNHKSKVAKYLIAIKDKFKYRRLLTGSPAPQGPHDLWTQFTFIGLTDQPYFGFRNTYCKMGGWMSKQIMGGQNLDILRMRTDHGVFRAKKADWTDLPEKLYPKPRDVEMTAKQRELYLRMMHDFVIEWGDKEITAKMAVTAKAKLSQIGSGFLYDNDGNTEFIFGPTEKNPKVEELKAVLDDVTGKVIIFYHFRPTMQILADAFKDVADQCVWLPSGLKEEEIEARKKVFNGDDNARYCFMQTTSYKYGHTMLGTPNEPCYTTVFFENSYDGEAREQAEARNHRHGQKYPVTYIDLAISREDRKVIAALQKKSGLQEAILQEFKSGTR